VSFRELESDSNIEEAQTEKEPNKLVFEIRNEEHDSKESIESNEEVETLNLVVRRLERVKKPIERYSPHYIFSTFLLSTIDEPKSVSEEIDSTEGKHWKDTMVEEMESLHKNETWDLVEIPDGRKPIDRKWEFKKKLNTTSLVNIFKARLVVKWFSQVKGVKNGDIFFHVAKLTSIILLMYIFVAFDLEIEKMGVKTTFLHRDLKK
jgi:hypothetical protein